MYKISVSSKITFHSDAADFFEDLAFYNKPIEKPKVKRLKTLINLLNFLFMSN